MAIAPYTPTELRVDEVPRGTSLNQRERDIVHLKGWKLRFFVKNTYDVPVTLRYAMIAPRQTWNLATAVTKSASFLRSYGSTRALNMGSVNSGLSNTKNPINDDMFMVMQSNTLEIGPNAGATGYTGGVQANWQQHDQWYPY